MARASFEGHIGTVFNKNGGIVFTLCEQPHWDCKQKTWYRLAAWGKVATALSPSLKQGKAFKFTCRIDVKTQDGKSFTNFTVLSWGEVIKPIKSTPASRQEPSDDWFEPKIRDRDTSSARRYEGFSS